MEKWKMEIWNCKWRPDLNLNDLGVDSYILLSFIQQFNSWPNLQCWKYFYLKVNNLKIGIEENNKINNDVIQQNVIILNNFPNI